MQMPAPAGGTLGWQIEQYGPNGPLPHTGAGAVFLCAGRSWGAVDSALLPTDPAKLCTECQRKFGCNIILKIFKMRDFLDKFYLRESFMRKIHK